MTRKILIAIFIVLVLILATVTVFKIRGNRNKSIENTPQNFSSIELPIKLNEPVVGSMFLHYFLSGAIKNVEKVDGQYLVTLVEDSGSLPSITIDQETRVSKISAPYNEKTTEKISPARLKKGLKIDISTEYDLRAKQWFTRDIFVPTDKNPNF